MDLRREVGHFNRTVRRYQTTIGEAVIWYEYDPTSTYHPVYDEGPALRWRRPLVVPVMHVVEQEDPERDTPEGRLPTSVISFDLLSKTAEQVGLSDVRESNGHLNDIVGYDGRYYELRVYRNMGRMREDLVIHVEGTEVFLGQEYTLDEPFQHYVGFTNAPSTPSRETTSSEDLM